MQPNKSALKTLLTNGRKTKPLHGKYPIRAGDRDVDQTLTQQLLEGSALKPKTEGPGSVSSEQELLVYLFLQYKQPNNIILLHRPHMRHSLLKIK